MAERWKCYRVQGEWDTDGQLQLVFLKPKASAAVSISSDDDTDSTEESDCEYDS